MFLLSVLVYIVESNVFPFSTLVRPVWVRICIYIVMGMFRPFFPGFFRDIWVMMLLYIFDALTLDYCYYYFIVMCLVYMDLIETKKRISVYAKSDVNR